VRRGRAAADEIEVDQFLQRPLQRCGRVVAGALRPQHKGVACVSERIGPEEASNAVRDGRPVGELLVEARKHLAEIPDRILLHPFPELAQACDPVLDLVAGDQARVDGTDRGADDPVRLDAGLMQGLVDAGLIGAERAATLEHQHDLAGQVLGKLLDALGLVLDVAHALFPIARRWPVLMFELGPYFVTAAPTFFLSICTAGGLAH